MKKIYKYAYLSGLFLITFFGSCRRENPMVDHNMSGRIEISATATSNSITLSWQKVEGAKWYRISYETAGEVPEVFSNYQDNINNPIKFTAYDLKPNTTYKCKVEGRAELDANSQVKASGTKEVKTTN